MNITSKLASSVLALGLVASFVGSPTAIDSASGAVKQTWMWNITGDCNDYFEMNDEYAMFEEEPDWSCKIWAKVTPASIKRTFYLQYFDLKWKTEATGKTSTKGYVYLYPDALNCDGYCDGTVTYRLYSPAVSGQKAFTSATFDITFYPVGWDEEDETVW